MECESIQKPKTLLSSYKGLIDSSTSAARPHTDALSPNPCVTSSQIQFGMRLVSNDNEKNNWQCLWSNRKWNISVTRDKWL